MGGAPDNRKLYATSGAKGARSRGKPKNGSLPQARQLWQIECLGARVAELLKRWPPRGPLSRTPRVAFMVAGNHEVKR